MSFSEANLQLKREKINVLNTIGTEVKKIEIENKINFPVKVGKIYDTFITLKNLDAKILANKVVVDGEIFTQVYYIAGETLEVDGNLYEEGEIYEETFTESFSAFTEIPGTNPKMDAEVQCRVKGFKWKHKGLKKSDTWQQIIECELFVQVTETVKKDIVVDVFSSDANIETTKERLKFESIVGKNTKKTEFIDEIDFAEAVKEIKNITASIKDIDYKIEANKVIVEGILSKKVYYEEFETGFLKEKVFEDNFTSNVEILGAESGQNVDVDIEIEYLDVDLNDGDEKEGFVKGRQKTVLNISVKVTKDVELDVVTSVKGDSLEVKKDILKVDTIVAEDIKRIDLEQNLYFNRPVKKIVETGSDLKFNYTDTKLDSGEVVVAGELNKLVYFVDQNEEAVFEENFIEEFRTTFDFPNAKKDMNLRVKGKIEEIKEEKPEYPEYAYRDFEEGDFEPEKYPWKQTTALEIFAKVTETTDLEVVTDVKMALTSNSKEKEAEAPELDVKRETSRPSLKFYIVQPGDTIYTVGERFQITLEEIQNKNPDLDLDNIEIGQKILIPCENL